MHFVTCPKQGLEMEAVVLHRVGFLAYFCSKQGQNFNPPGLNHRSLTFSAVTVRFASVSVRQRPNRRPLPGVQLVGAKREKLKKRGERKLPLAAFFFIFSRADYESKQYCVMTLCYHSCHGVFMACMQ